MEEFRSKRISRDELKPGDHIYSWRTAYVYAHHGIYVGDGNVIHFTPATGRASGSSSRPVICSSLASSATGGPCPKCGYYSGLSGVLSSCIECFLAGDDICLFEYDVSIPYLLKKLRGGTCSTLSSDSPEEVLHRAYYLLKNNKGFGGYKLFQRNCEDFAIYCKTGRILTDGSANRIGQKTEFLLRTTGILGLPVAWFCSPLISENRMRKNAQKIPVETLVSEYLSK